MNYWMIVTSRDNFEISKELSFSMVGMKSRWEKAAAEVRPKDKFVYYITKESVFEGIAQAMSTYWTAESEDDPWKPKVLGTWNDPKRKLNYPFRINSEVVVILPRGSGVPAINIHHKLKYLAKWPSKHWKLGFQGNVHKLDKDDYDLIHKEVMAAHQK
jgi:hypothetical protein